MTRGVFLDTVGLLATWDTRDQWHRDAAPVFESLLRDQAILVTTEFVLAECANAAARRPYRKRVAALRDLLLPEGCVIHPIPADIEQAWTQYQRGGIDSPGLVDYLSFQAMRRLRISEVFSNDKHFRAFGFVTLF